MCASEPTSGLTAARENRCCSRCDRLAGTAVPIRRDGGPASCGPRDELRRDGWLSVLVAVNGDRSIVWNFRGRLVIYGTLFSNEASLQGKVNE